MAPPVFSTGDPIMDFFYTLFNGIAEVPLFSSPITGILILAGVFLLQERLEQRPGDHRVARRRAVPERLEGSPDLLPGRVPLDAEISVVAVHVPGPHGQPLDGERGGARQRLAEPVALDHRLVGGGVEVDQPSRSWHLSRSRGM